MSAQNRVGVPSVNRIVAHWRTVSPQWLKSFQIGWGEPFCFACGWLAPVRDGKRVSWTVAGRWLDRAHLHDRAYGGPDDDPANYAMLCHLCHDAAPDFPDRETGLRWVKDRDRTEPVWQVWTDARLWDVIPLQHRTIVRSRMEYLEMLRRVQLEPVPA